MDVISRIFALMESTSTTAAQLTRDVPLTNGLVTQWKQGKQKPSLDAVVKLAKYFNVSTDYLLGLTDSPAPSNEKERQNFKLITSEKKGEIKMENKLNQHDITLFEFMESNGAVSRNDIINHFGENSHFVYRFDNMIIDGLYFTEAGTSLSMAQYANNIFYKISQKERDNLKSGITSAEMFAKSINLSNMEGFIDAFKDAILEDEIKENHKIYPEETKYTINGYAKIEKADYEIEKQAQESIAVLAALKAVEAMIEKQKSDSEFGKEIPNANG